MSDPVIPDREPDREYTLKVWDGDKDLGEEGVATCTNADLPGNLVNDMLTMVSSILTEVGCHQSAYMLTHFPHQVVSEMQANDEWKRRNN